MSAGIVRGSYQFDPDLRTGKALGILTSVSLSRS